MNTQHNNSSGNQIKEFFRNIFITSATFTLSLLSYIALVGFFPKFLILTISAAVLIATCFALYKPEKVGIFYRKTFLVPLLIISLMGVMETTIRDPQPRKEKTTMTASSNYQTLPKKIKKSNHSEKTKEFLWIEDAKDNIRNKLKDSKSAQFRNTRFTHFEGIPVVCGEVNSKNSFGGMTGYQHFVATGANLVLLEEQVADFHKVWNKMCR